MDARTFTDRAKMYHERAYAMIVDAAVKGERCPLGWPHGPIMSGAIPALVDAGRIRSEVYARNWRVVIILDGEHAGKRTAPPPWGGSPYLVNGVNIDLIARRQRKIAP